MNQITWALVAASCAGAMVLLVRAGVGADLRAALRTTIVLLVGWVFAGTTYKPVSLHALSHRTWLLLSLSCAALVTSWTVYFRRARQPESTGTLSIDQINIGFAILYAVLLFSSQPTSQSAMGALAIVAGAVFLARR